MRLFCLLYFAGLLSGSLALAAGPADAIFHDGTITTGIDDQPTTEAVAVKDGKIHAVGTRDEVLKTRGD